jgi:predicted nucleotidyltransferase
MTFLCERCKRDIYRNEICNYCSKKICNDCVKSSQRIQKVTRLVICKDCWSNMRKRGAFKNRKGELKIEARE